MPAGFRVGTLDPDVYLPMPIYRQKPDAIGSRSFVCYGRLRAGVSLDSARAEMTIIADRLGRRIVVAWTNEAPTEIVGVVGDIRQDAVTADPEPTVFMAQAQVPAYFTPLVVRTSGDPKRLVKAIRHSVQEVDKAQPVTGIETMQEHISASLARPRLHTATVTAFAGLALMLAALGIYGLMAYSVHQKRGSVYKPAARSQPSSSKRSTHKNPEPQARAPRPR